MIALIVVGVFFDIPAYSQSSQLQAKYDAQKDEVNNQINSINEELFKLTSNIHDVTQRKNTLKEEVAGMQAEIDSINNLINQTKIAINQLDEQIQSNQEQINILQEEMKVLIRQIQKQDKISPLELLLTSRNLSEVLSNIYNLSTLQVQASNLNQKIEATQQELKENRRVQDEVQKTLNDTQALLKSKQDGIKILLEKTEGEEAKYQSLINQVNEQKSQADAQLVTIDQNFNIEIQRELEEQAKREAERRRLEQIRNGTAPGNGISGGYTNGNEGDGCFFKEGQSLNAPAGFFASPTDGYVSQNFWCQGVYGHDGWDIANGLGTPIRASANGSVVTKGFHNGGFGNYILLQHNLPSGTNVYTLYAHMNTPAIVDGGVSQGQIIGYMGSTGYSTGPHLHFMIISNSYNTTGNLGCHYGSSKCYDPSSVF
ncbi:peptidoglycan DD-metalloendopeptidase family protein [Candidatus Gracilibacteria bacterium]|nr:peptidoglycan DD-metalloendopeptidase family protein [Candidatus Gracilibacteria bacterium]NJS40803.1 peptidoglycan DD-metalloendopeptidase family protein [Candidatus Gracilibacteria bacterium]